MNARHVPAAMAIAYIHYVTNGEVTLTTGQIRVWATRGHTKRVGTTPTGFALYDLDAILRHVQKRHAPEKSQTRVISDVDAHA